MKRAVTLLAVALTACSSPQPADTTPIRPPAGITSTSISTTTSSEHSETTTSTQAPDQPGSESIGVTDKVTIVITDPDD